jgi:hypothetical protein
MALPTFLSLGKGALTAAGAVGKAAIRNPMAAGVIGGGAYGYGASDSYTLTGRLEDAARGALFLGGGIGAAKYGARAVGFMARRSLMKEAAGVVGPHQFSKWMRNPEFAKQFSTTRAFARPFQRYAETARDTALRKELAGVVGPDQLNRYMKDPRFAREFAEYSSLRYNLPVQGTLAAARPFVGAGRAAAGLGMAAGGLAVRHPGKALGLGAAAYGTYAAYSGFADVSYSPTLQGKFMYANYDQQAMQAEAIRSMFVQQPGPMGSSQEYFNQIQREQQQNIATRMRQSVQGLVQGLHSGRHG